VNASCTVGVAAVLSGIRDRIHIFSTDGRVKPGYDEWGGRFDLLGAAP
jgi:hypothetical protein